MLSCRRVNQARTVVSRRGYPLKLWCAWGEGWVLVCPLALRGEEWGEKGCRERGSNPHAREGGRF